MINAKIIPIAIFAATLAGPSFADTGIASAGLVLPEMNAEAGRTLFASKGCVVCHSINDVGGLDGPMLDAEFMELPMNPFDFAARMWQGAEAMVELQRDELGGVIELNGEELAAIIAFVHDAEAQKKFSEADIPEEIEAMMGHTDEGEEEDGHGDAEEEADGHGEEEEAPAEEGHD